MFYAIRAHVTFQADTEITSTHSSLETLIDFSPYHLLELCFSSEEYQELIPASTSTFLELIVVFVSSPINPRPFKVKYANLIFKSK
jgi:hypothetical protein